MPDTKTIIRTDEGTLTLDFDPAAHKTAEAAAKALYEALLPKVRAAGQTPDYELAIRTPDETPRYLVGGYRAWWVVWEAGPFDWAINASFRLHRPEWWTEPYYGFDLLFYDRERSGGESL